MFQTLCRSSILVFAGGLSACFAIQELAPDDLQNLSSRIPVRVTAKDGKEIRGVVGPGDVDGARIRMYRLRYGPDTWTVRWGGWPAVYTAGKYRRWELDGETVEVPLDQVEGLSMERYSWGLTFLSFPLTLPVGLVDFAVHQAQFGFEDQGMRSDGFGSRPEGGRPEMGSIQEGTAAPPAPAQEEAASAP